MNVSTWTHAVLDSYEKSVFVKIITWAISNQIGCSLAFWKKGNKIFDFDVDHVWKIRMDLDQIFEWSYEIIHDFLKNLRKFLSLFFFFQIWNLDFNGSKSKSDDIFDILDLFWVGLTVIFKKSNFDFFSQLSDFPDFIWNLQILISNNPSNLGMVYGD